MGLVAIYGGWIGGIMSISYELGKVAGPNKWYGKNDNKWFE